MLTPERPGWGVRYALTAGPGDVGCRLVVRRRLPGGGLSDLLGHLESWADGVLLLRDRHGLVVSVDEADVVAAKRVPEPPPRRAG